MTPISNFYQSYIQDLFWSLRDLSIPDLSNVIKVLKEAQGRGLPIFVMGNGGSATISEHLQCDWFKGVGCATGTPLNVRSLVSNTGLLTALGNDLGYDEIFSKQLELEISLEGVAVFISSSGNSPNIIKGINMAHQRGYTSIGLTGFDGGKLKKLCNHSLHINTNNYGVVEDAHQAIMHAISQYLQT